MDSNMYSCVGGMACVTDSKSCFGNYKDGAEMTDIKLKPCPFCGGVAKVYHEKNHGGIDGSVVRCERCGAKAEWKRLSYDCACDYGAVEAWNRRINGQTEFG